jgi:hypothetical protein
MSNTTSPDSSTLLQSLQAAIQALSALKELMKHPPPSVDVALQHLTALAAMHNWSETTPTPPTAPSGRADTTEQALVTTVQALSLNPAAALISNYLALKALGNSYKTAYFSACDKLHLDHPRIATEQVKDGTVVTLCHEPFSLHIPVFATTTVEATQIAIQVMVSCLARSFLSQMYLNSVIMALVRHGADISDFQALVRTLRGPTLKLLFHKRDLRALLGIPKKAKYTAPAN